MRVIVLVYQLHRYFYTT